MEPAELVKLGVAVSVGLTVFSIGLQTAARDLGSFLGRPGLVIRSLVAMNVIMPLLALVFALRFRLEPAVTVALVALSLSPVPPILPRKQFSVSDDTPYVLGLLTIGSALAVVVAPLVLALVSRTFGRDLEVAPGTIARALTMSVFVPVVAGFVVQRFWPAAARRLAPVAAKVGGVLLLVVVIALIVVAHRPMWTLVGNGTLLAMVAFAGVGLLVGHLLGGPDRGDRAVLALATATRHPGVAIAIASSASQVRNVGAAVLLYLLVSTLVSAPYVARRKSRRADVHAPPLAAARTRKM